MRRHRTDQEKKMTGRERLDLYKKIFFEARPIWKWLALSCLLCTVIIICSVLGPKITGELTNQICNYWEAKVSGGALWDLVREMLPGLLALLGVYTCLLYTSLLEHHGKELPGLVPVHVCEIPPINPNFSRGDVVEAHEQVYNGGLSRPCGPHNGNGLPRLRHKAQVPDEGLLGVIGEGHMARCV